MSQKAVPLRTSPLSSLFGATIFQRGGRNFPHLAENHSGFLSRNVATAVWTSFSDSHIRFIQPVFAIVPITCPVMLHSMLLSQIWRFLGLATGVSTAESDFLPELTDISA